MAVRTVLATRRNEGSEVALLCIIFLTFCRMKSSSLTYVRARMRIIFLLSMSKAAFADAQKDVEWMAVWM